MTNIARLIEKIMKQRKLSYMEIAELSELTSDNAIRMYRYGKATMPVKRQKILAENLGIPVDAFKKAFIADIKELY